mmetsp:Transcript_8645/g.11359  ORF Transcript_8645/g.11359 Transcript_8645/m.11359 type:complete len:90 (+) Transcript_8645:350-619(+)
MFTRNRYLDQQVYNTCLIYFKSHLISRRAILLKHSEMMPKKKMSKVETEKKNCDDNHKWQNFDMQKDGLNFCSFCVYLVVLVSFLCFPM